MFFQGKGSRKPSACLTSSAPQKLWFSFSHLPRGQERWRDISPPSASAQFGSLLHASNFIPWFLRCWYTSVKAHLPWEPTFWKGICNNTFPYWMSTKVNIWILPTLIFEAIQFSVTCHTRQGRYHVGTLPQTPPSPKGRNFQALGWVQAFVNLSGQSK